MSRDDPSYQSLAPICILFLDTQICVDESGAISVYTGASNDESDDGFRHVGSASSVVGSYFDSVEDIERRLREWADENRGQIDACIRHAKEIASLSARVGHLEACLDAAQASLKVGLPAGPMQRHQGNARDDGGQAMSEGIIEEIRKQHESPGGMLPMEALGRSIEARAFLLAENARLRAERGALREIILSADAEWWDKKIHPVDSDESYQNWKIVLYLPVPCNAADKEVESALDRAVALEGGQ